MKAIPVFAFVMLLAATAIAGENLKSRDLKRWYADRKAERLLDIEELQREIEEDLLNDKDTKEKESLMSRLVTSQFMPPELDMSVLDVGDMGVIFNHKDSEDEGETRVSLVQKQIVTVDRKRGYLLQYKVWRDGRVTRHVGWIINLGTNTPPQLTIYPVKGAKSRIPLTSASALAKVIQIRTVTLPTGDKVKAPVLTLVPIPGDWLRLPKAKVE